MAKLIVVVGVTGNQGGSVAQKFLSIGWKVRGITRSSMSHSAQSLASKGVEIIEADLDNSSSLIFAFRSAHAIFAMTDFWEPFFAFYGDLSNISDRAAGQYALDLEVRRGKNLIDAADKALKEGGLLERFIWSTLPSFMLHSKGKYPHAYHFDGKAEVTRYLKGKSKLWARSSLLNMGFYATNMLNMPKLVGVSKDESLGKYVLRTPCTIDAMHPFVDPADTGIFVEALVSSSPGQDFLGVSEMASFATYMKVWSEVTGEPSETRQITVEDADKDVPRGLGRMVAESTATSAECGWGDQLVLPNELDAKLRTTSLEEYMRREDWRTFLNQF